MFVGTGRRGNRSLRRQMVFRRLHTSVVDSSPAHASRGQNQHRIPDSTAILVGTRRRYAWARYPLAGRPMVSALAPFRSRQRHIRRQKRRNHRRTDTFRVPLRPRFRRRLAVRVHRFRSDRLRLGVRVARSVLRLAAVSYTHLTLPTILRV